MIMAAGSIFFKKKFSAGLANCDSASVSRGLIVAAETPNPGPYHSLVRCSFATGSASGGASGPVRRGTSAGAGRGKRGREEAN